MAAATIFQLLAPVVAVAQLLAPGVSPGREFGAVTGGVEIIQVDELQVDGAGDKAGVEERLKDLLPRRKGGEVTVSLQDSRQRGGMAGASLDTIRQAVDDILVRA
jgi:hypothetical protein